MNFIGMYRHKNIVSSALLFVILGISSLVFSGCNDIFRDAPVDKVSETVVWSNVRLLEEYESSWYRKYDHGFSVSIFTFGFLKEKSRFFLPWFGDQITTGNGKWLNSCISDMTVGSPRLVTNWAAHIWDDAYVQIATINLLFENQDKLISGPIKDRVLGEAHFFRGMYYFKLLQHFGGPLLIKETYDPLNEDIFYPRASYKEMIDFIAEEATLAAELLPVKYNKENIGRATKGAALMLKAKAYQWVSSPKFQNQQKDFYGFLDDRSSEMRKESLEAFNELFSLNAYSLCELEGTTEDAIADSYRKIFTTRNSAESIYEIQHSSEGNYDSKFGHKLDRLANFPHCGGTNCAFTPTENHVEEYEMRDGTKFDWDNAEHLSNPYANRDYRFYANILYDGSVYRDYTLDMHYVDGKAGEDISPYADKRTNGYSRTGYYMAKFLDETQVIDNDPVFGSKQNYIVWRYAEALLDYAELSFLEGDSNSALEYVNLVRERAHMNKLTEISWEAIVHERRIELAFENASFWDILRWGIAEKQFSGDTNPLKAMKINVDSKSGKKTYSVENLNSNPLSERSFISRQYYLPISRSDVKYHSIEQNDGWDDV